MYRIPVCRIELVRERTLAAETKTIRSPADAAAIVRDYIGDADREHFVVLCLDGRHKVVAINTVSVGSLDTAFAHPREVFKPAVLSNSAAVVLAHNHPSGDPEPSPDDCRITARLTNAGNILGITVLDHVIVGQDERFCSLKQRGLLS
jgi:DNA repair protein RadC